ncbi:hypothetical protein ACTMU2_25680 [Cupriavidus basilensis]
MAPSGVATVGQPRVGMQASMAGLACWSFLMAGVHGAGLMLVPVLMPPCVSPSLSGPDQQRQCHGACRRRRSASACRRHAGGHLRGGAAGL